MNSGQTLSRFLRESTGQNTLAGTPLASVLEAFSGAAVRLSSQVSQGRQLLSTAATSYNASGEAQQALDLRANQLFISALKESGLCRTLASEESQELLTLNKDAPYLIAIDPLDGSTNAESNLPMGSIFSVYQAPAKEDISKMPFPAGKEQIAAGYFLYGPATMLVFTAGHGVHGFTLDRTTQEFHLSHPGLKIPHAGSFYSINEGYYSLFCQGTKRFIHYCQYPDYETGRPFSSRYSGALVADLHRILLDGGIFLYPASSKYPQGKLRLLYECQPLALIIEQAGGRATNGTMRILDLQAANQHQRTPLLTGSASLVTLAGKIIHPALKANLDINNHFFMKNLQANTLNLSYLGFPGSQSYHYQLPVEELRQHIVAGGEGRLSNHGVLAVSTGKFTGRSPKDRYIVQDRHTQDTVWWNDINIPFSPTAFNFLYNKMLHYLQTRTVFVRDAFASAEEDNRISLRIISEKAYQDLFAHNLFIRPAADTENQPEWTVLAAPGFKADPALDQTRQANFSIINFSRRIILIGGSGYTGEIKKAVFSVLNFLLPQRGILPMHCAANLGKEGDTAIFFGLSGTGKTTLSADPVRRLIGDDEHGWSRKGIFNFEGGCYAKTAGLSRQNEPQIWQAIRPGALLENVGFHPDSDQVDFNDTSITENTRVSYPLSYVKDAADPSTGPAPRNIFFLTADAFGVLPPVARLNMEQALYYFSLGYTAKVAGTEFGINEPQATFSHCFGQAFMPLHPSIYAGLLGDLISEHQPNIWLINTGWTGGSYGTGQRISLSYTRAIVHAALSGELEQAGTGLLEIFKLEIPKSCPGVPAEILDPATAWTDKEAYRQAAIQLAEKFRRQLSSILQKTDND
ncbi:phosphoenolpyruvate carboxykinase (ATP) [Pedobacter sp. HMF7647]|uniref:Multifunctional fusion protein n=1 Tax=Hufsiella arboris TaxID=2695275 RepID=A0A7K1Y6U5_9SPHI|nr:phosphoenolpyruvate carboxykinase (ATP) [Hufsiella arboris]MXV50287.1 phosphoenolpyruvate carboxykinase (ATP) [Hufsiella arboris]